MYTPRLTQEKDWETIASFIRENSFALLISNENGLPIGTHLPLELIEKTPGVFVLQGHIANANPQSATFAGTQSFLAVFTNPHAYISSSWYEKDKIPTWNYIAVHVYGALRVMNNEELVEHLTAMMTHYEAASAHPVSMKDIPEKELQNNLKAITGFEISIDRIDTRFKLSQNKNDHDHASIVEHLKASGDQSAQRIAEEMQKRRNMPQV